MKWILILIILILISIILTKALLNDVVNLLEIENIEYLKLAQKDANEYVIF